MNNKVNTLYKRSRMNSRVVFEITDLIEQNTLIATVYVVGIEIAHMYFIYKDNTTEYTKHKEYRDAQMWIYGAIQTFDGLFNANLIDETVDWGDELKREEV